YYAHFGADPNARDKYRGEPWFELAERFADDWDQTAFDPDYDTLPLEHFEPLVRARLASAQIVYDAVCCSTARSSSSAASVAVAGRLTGGVAHAGAPPPCLALADRTILRPGRPRTRRHV